MQSCNQFIARCQRRNDGAALVLVLALVVLVTGLVVAYLSRTTSDRSAAHGSFHETKVDQLAQSAVENIIGNLRQEILNGSGSPSPTASPVALFVPTSNTNIVARVSPTPALGTTPNLPNLIRRSASSDIDLWPDPVVGPAVGSRASAVNSTTDVSANGRSISLKRWNSHYLLPKYDPASTDPTPPSPLPSPFNPNPPITGGFIPPDWVFVTNTGAMASPAPNHVVGRYAYAIYDEGGLIDMNAAGYPSPTSVSQYGRKGSLAFADLTVLPGLDTATDKIVGWRNYASAQPSGTFPNLTFTANSTNTYFSFILSDPNYIQLPNYLINQTPPLAYSPIFFLRTAWQAPTQNNSNQTDQAFTSRQSLLNLRASVSSGLGFVNSLQYLSTSSREAMASVPQWIPTTPASTNPNFQNLYVMAPFVRNDGTSAGIGDYLVSQRFLLQRLNWITYKGPSASLANGGTRNAVPSAAPAINSSDYDLWLLTRSTGITFGLTSTFLQDSVIGGTPTNILKYFGLAWDPTNERWNYVGHNGGATPASSITTLGAIGTRDPDFFELLQAGILDSSLGDFASPDPALPSIHQQSKTLHVLAIGANLIAQSRVDSYPVRVACTAGGTVMEAVGIPRLPCINSLAACAVGATQSAGGVHWFLIPNLWDPFRDTWDLSEANSANNGNGPNLTPGYLRPPVRIRINGSVAFGSITASSSVVSGIAAASVTIFPSGSITGIDANQLFATGTTTNNWYGRDGFLEAMRLRTNDLSNGSSLPQFSTTSSPTTPLSEWDSLATTGMTQVGPGGNSRWMVLRLSLAGGNIPTSAFVSNQNPVLILQPGFQVSMEYQSPNGNWYPYSFLQGNNASNTWIGNTAPTRNLNLVTNYSVYAKASGTVPTIGNSASPTTVTPWATATLASAPMFAKADPRSARYNSEVGVLNIGSPPMASASAGVVGSLWPDAYTAAPTPTPPSFWTTSSPGPTPSPNPNPALYSQIGDNSSAGTDPYDENTASATHGDAVRPIMMNRPFRSVGEMGYAFRDQPFRTLNFSSTNSPDAGLLDLFTTVAYGPTPAPSPAPSISPSYPSPTPNPRAGVISLNSLQPAAVATVIASTIRREDTPRVLSAGAPSPAPSPVTATVASNTARALSSSTSSTPVVNRASLASLAAPMLNASPSPSLLDASVPKTQREAIVRALGEVDQTRTWNLMIDVIAQSGRFPVGANDLAKFVVEGEQRYWVHVAIDRFTNQVIDREIEVVKE